MIPIFKLLCLSCHMDADDAAEFLDIRMDTSVEMWQGKREPPDGILIQMKEEIDKHKMLEDTVYKRIENMSIESVLEEFARVDRSEMK